MQSDQVKELKQLQDENNRLKKRVADLSLDKSIVQDFAQQIQRLALREQAVSDAIECYRISERLACQLLRHHRATQHYESIRDPMTALRARMKELARTHVRYGHRRLLILLRREGWQIGKQLVYRLYCQESL